MNVLPQPLTPHSYPLGIKIASIISFILFFISLKDLPFFVKINYKIKKACIAFEEKNYQDAALQYTELIQLLPQNKYLKICAAKSFFKLTQQENHMQALHLLTDISLTEKEWKDLLCYMPEQYIELFEFEEDKK